jgi:hypothetical protein
MTKSVNAGLLSETDDPILLDEQRRGATNKKAAEEFAKISKSKEMQKRESNLEKLRMRKEKILENLNTAIKKQADTIAREEGIDATDVSPRPLAIHEVIEIENINLVIESEKKQLRLAQLEHYNAQIEAEERSRAKYERAVADAQNVLREAQDVLRRSEDVKSQYRQRINFLSSMPVTPPQTFAR